VKIQVCSRKVHFKGGHCFKQECKMKLKTLNHHSFFKFMEHISCLRLSNQEFFPSKQ